jgi:spermidine/putrescine transport system ATP-binding protein
MSASVEVRGVTKRYGGVTAVDDVSLTIAPAEFLTLLGPSGCGKTTLLRLIAGFETPDSGSLLIGGVDITNQPPYRRPVNQVFQSYALFPHLTVGENIGFGLRMQKMPAREIAQRIAESLTLVSLEGLENRRPHQLSGGQRQRVALARALAPRPQVLLLDEPLSALDAKLRRSMQLELKRLQRQLGVTFVFVTHDQEEALTMSDRVAVVNQGRIEQLGSATTIYHRPGSAFVADFLGQANLLKASVAERDLLGCVSIVKLAEGMNLRLSAVGVPTAATRVLLSIRPEKVLVSKTRPEAENVFAAVVEEEIFQGATDYLVLAGEGGLRINALLANESAITEAIVRGDKVWFALHADDLVVVQAD